MPSYTVVRLQRDPEPFGSHSFAILRDGVRVAEYRFNHRGEGDEIKVAGHWVACDPLVQGGGPLPLVVSANAAKFLDKLFAGPKV